MKTLIIYDNDGFIFYQGSEIKIPVGLQFTYIEIPKNKIVIKIDTTVNPHQVVFQDRQKTEIELMQEKMDLMQKALDDVILGGTI